MTTRFSSSGRTAISTGLALLLTFFLSTFVAGQEPAQLPRSRAIDTPESRAEKAADELVSLSPDRLIWFLRNEIGLLLEVKKTLVRKAYEQGRLLDPADLTDEALFRLVRENETVRVLVTREIEERHYVLAKPTEHELEREESGKTWRSVPVGGSDQEEVYWKTQQDLASIASQRRASLARQAQAVLPLTNSDFSNPVGTPSQDLSPQQLNPMEPEAEPPTPQPSDPRRETEMTDATPQWDASEMLSPDASQPEQPISPEQLPRLLQASSGSGLPPDEDARDSRRLTNQEQETGQNSQIERGRGYPELYPQTARRELPNQGQQWQQERNFQERPLQPSLRHRPNPYADIPALYDLYSQYSSGGGPLERFGSEIFRNGTGNLDRLPMDMPVGPEYVLGPGDGLSIELWGGVSQRLLRAVDRQGRVALPEVGSVEVSGKSLGQVQHLVQSALRTQFRDVRADVSLSRLRSVRIYVVGDVQRPGAYDVSALSTPLNAVYLAGGPTSAGSLRVVRHYRVRQLVQQIDLYDLLLHGISSDLQGLQAGDTILIPSLGPEITVEGMVRRPAVYELSGEKSLAEVLQLAGGVLQSGTLRHVDVERVESHLSRTMLRLDIPQEDNEASVTKALQDFQIQEGDIVKISPILPYADKTVYLEGHVFRPGKFAYRDGMTLIDVVHSYKDLLPEPCQSHAEIIRLRPPDYRPQVLAFNLDAALDGKDQNLVLKPFDTIRIFGRFDFEDPPVITVSGEVRDPGDHITNGITHLRDAVFLAGGASADAELSDAQVFRRTDDGKLKVVSINLSKALAGDPTQNLLLAPNDRVFIHKDLSRSDPAAVSIQGEVARPGKYPLGENMTASDLVRLAGGLKRSAFTESADLTRYTVEQESQVMGEHLVVHLEQALAGESDTDLRLRDGDVLTVRQLAGWTDIGATITVTGEVVHPGTYGIKEGERLSSILARAGGLRGDAYPYGAVFERNQVRQLEETNHQQLIHEIRDQGSTLRQAPDGDQDQKLAKQAALQQWETTLDELLNTPPSGRLVIHISRDLKRWVNTSADIPVRAGDSVYIPKPPNTVVVDGSVYNPTAITFRPGRDARWYLQQAGGPTSAANRKAIIVIRADGSVAGGTGGPFNGGVDRSALQPGDMVVVPEKVFSANTHWKSVLEGAQLAYAVGIAIQVAKSF